MRLLHAFRAFLREWLRHRSLDEELREELSFHTDREIQNNLEAGMTPAQARQAARLAIGHPDAIREDARDARWGALAHQVLREIAYGWRLMRKTPIFALTSVAIVA